MGVTRAADAYVKIYGSHDKRVHLNENPPKDLPPNNPDYCNVYLLDLPTYHVPSIYALSARAGEAIVRSDANMGQLIVFESEGIIYDMVYDRTSCIDPSDVQENGGGGGGGGGGLTTEHKLNAFKNFKRASSFGDTPTINSFCSKFKKHVIDNKREVSLVPVTTGESCSTLEKLRDHVAVKSRSHLSRLQPEDLITPLSSHHQQQQKPSPLAFRAWLTANGLKEPKYINFEHIFNAVNKNNQYGNNRASDAYMYNAAKIAIDMEGLLLLYGHYLIGKLRNVISDKKATKKIVLFADGKSPVIKNITKVKREEARKSKVKEQQFEAMEEEGNTEMLIKEACGLFDRIIMSIPSTLLIQCVVLDVLRVVLFDQLGISGDHFFFSSTDGSEAEDDIVRLIALAANIDLAVKGDVKTLSKISAPSLSSPERIRKIEITTANYLKRPVTWEKACRESLFNAKHNRVIALSYDSDVLPKWNMLVAHARSGNNNNKRRLDMSPVANNIDSVYFYRSLMERWYNNNSSSKVVPLSDEDSIDYDDESPSNPLKRKTYEHRSGFSSINSSKVCVYDMLQSPLCLTGEDTLLLLLTNGCDYNDALVSSEKTLGQHVSKMREEVAMFKKYACMCPLPPDDDDDDNHRRRRCEKCSKVVEKGFVTIKKFLMENAVDATLKEEFPGACNVAANLFAMIAMSSFNTKMFGSGVTVSKPDEAAREVERIVNHAKMSFFNRYTQGGVPLASCTLEKERDDVFGAIGSIKREVEDRKSILEMYEESGNDIFLSSFDDDPSPDTSMTTTTTTSPLVDESTLMELFNASNAATPSKGSNNTSSATAMTTTEYDDDFINSILFDNDAAEGAPHKPKKLKKSKDNAFSCLPLDWFKGGSAEDHKHPTPSAAAAAAAAAAPEEGDEEDVVVVEPALAGAEESISKLDKAMTTCSSQSADDFFLSLLTNMLKGGKETRGVDDKRTNNETYCSKVMNLLIILYANMAGQQDPTVSRNQYIPVVHVEAVANRAAAAATSSAAAATTTTRSYFVAALNELNIYMYRPELNASSKYKQTKRQRWDKLAEKLASYDREMEACGVAKSMVIKPVYGLSRVRPWSTLALIGARLHLEHLNNGNSSSA